MGGKERTMPNKSLVRRNCFPRCFATQFYFLLNVFARGNLLAMEKEEGRADMTTGGKLGQKQEEQ